MEITYTKVGDYLIPDLTLPPEKEHRSIGIWGKRHKRYLMEHKKAIFTIMQMNVLRILNIRLASILMNVL